MIAGTGEALTEVRASPRRDVSGEPDDDGDLSSRLVAVCSGTPRPSGSARAQLEPAPLGELISVEADDSGSVSIPVGVGDELEEASPTSGVRAVEDAELAAAADSVRAYLRQLRAVALLTAAEEVALAKRIEAGLFAAER